MKVEMVVADDRVEAVLRHIQIAAKTGKVGDGKVFVTDVRQVIRIRTGETGNPAC